jgi:hypothetical protein
MRALTHLHLVESVDPVVRTDLLVKRQTATELVEELSHRG